MNYRHKIIARLNKKADDVYDWEQYVSVEEDRLSSLWNELKRFLPEQEIKSEYFVNENTMKKAFEQAYLENPPSKDETNKQRYNRLFGVHNIDDFTEEAFSLYRRIREVRDKLEESFNRLEELREKKLIREDEWKNKQLVKELIKRYNELNLLPSENMANDAWIDSQFPNASPEVRNEFYRQIQAKTNYRKKITARLNKKASSYFDLFFAEKDIPFVQWELTDSKGVDHIINNEVVIEAIKGTSGEEKKKIEDVLRRLDFANADINDFLKHLAHGLIENY